MTKTVKCVLAARPALICNAARDVLARLFPWAACHATAPPRQLPRISSAALGAWEEREHSDGGTTERHSEHPREVLAPMRWGGSISLLCLFAPQGSVAQTSSYWSITSGSQYCQLASNGRCVTDGIGNHANNERCTVRANQALAASTTQYQVERHFDYLTIGGTSYRSGTGPSNVRMSSGQTLTWYSDRSITCTRPANELQLARPGCC